MRSGKGRSMNAGQFDVMIIGTGPAGLTGAIFAQRLGLRTIAFGDIPGGNLYMIEKLVNFPGFTDGVAGTEFGVTLFQQARQEGARLPMTRLQQLEHIGNGFRATDNDGQEYTATCAIIATGRTPLRLPGTRADMRGIHFCSVCDGPLYRDKKATLAVVGSDNAAAQHTLTLARTAAKVFLLFRGPRPLMDPAHQGLLARHDNIAVRPQIDVVGFTGLDLVETVQIRSADGTQGELAVDGVFLAIGWRPNTEMLAFEVTATAAGYLKTGPDLMTSKPGLFAAGDVRETDLWQVLTACADGARAARSAAAYMSQKG
jgi:thioredoxin reductase (NADPH)